MLTATDDAGRLAALRRALLLLPLAILLYVAVINAWAADDAFISFRTVRNLWEGFGLTWNPGWRVQAFTHPLWLLVAVLNYGISRECYFSVLFTSVLITLLCGVAIFGLRRGIELRVRTAIALVFTVSAAAMQYAVSGLENPLLFLLLLVYVAVLETERDGLSWRSSLVLSLIGLTRIDALVLVGPSFALTGLHGRMRWRGVMSIAGGLLPLGAWHVFSLIYYGIPYPNTAIAKLNIDVPPSRLWHQGLVYLADSFERDPVSLTVIGLCVGFLLRYGDKLQRAYAVGILLHVVYVVRVGGDFMTGRFVGAPFVFSLAAVMACGPLRTASVRVVAGATVAIACYGFMWPNSPWLFHFSRSKGMTLKEAVDETGIADERGFYYRKTGLLHMLADGPEIEKAGYPMPPQEWAQDGLDYARSSANFIARNSVGFFGYFAGNKHVVDKCGLADPFLARIRECSGAFRIGHCVRAIPVGYAETLVFGPNRIKDPALARLYEQVRALAVEPLFSRTRWQAIACLNLGVCDTREAPAKHP